MFTLNLEDIFNQTSFNHALKKLKHTSIGLDGLNIEDICNEKFFNDLKIEILSCRYSPTPVKQYMVPKEDKNEFRHLSVPSLKDKLVQNILALELSRYFDQSFSNCSYAYRPNKSYKNAIFRTRDFFKIHSYIIKTDIKNFFDNIDHEILLKILQQNITDSRIIRLIKLWISNGEFSKFNYSHHNKGVHQGDVLSPLLSNIYLNQMDTFLHKKSIDFVRYADDFVIFADNEQAAQYILDDLKNFLATIKLTLNDTKTAIYDKDTDFTFLGVNFKGEYLSISDEKFSSTLKKLSDQINTHDIKDAIARLNNYISHLRTIKLSLFSQSQKDSFMRDFDETITNLVRKFVKTIDKQTIANALAELEFAYHINQTLKKKKLISYYKNAKLPRVKSVNNALETKKREYIRNFSHNSILHITTPFLFLGLSCGKFILRQNGKITHKFPINQITQIIINTQISLSSAIIKECCKKQIPIDFIDEKTNLSYATLFTPNQAIPKNTTLQISLLKTKKSIKIAQQFIFGKLKNQINYLKYLNKYHKELMPYIETMQEILKNKILETTNINELMGFEGSAANAYWQAISVAIGHKFNFTGRITQGATDVVNSSLNYGYAILYSKILKSIVATGLSPHVSYLHALNEQKPTLAFDLIEEFRTFIVDRTIISMVNKNEPFEISEGMLSVKTRQNITKNINERFFAYTRYRSEEIRGEDIILRQAYALKHSIVDNQKYKPFIGRFQ